MRFERLKRFVRFVRFEMFVRFKRFNKFNGVQKVGSKFHKIASFNALCSKLLATLLPCELCAKQKKIVPSRLRA